MTKTLKQLVHVLWAIEKDLSVIASNTEAFRMRYVGCDDPGPKGPLGHPNVSKKQGNVHENPELLEEDK